MVPDLIARLAYFDKDPGITVCTHIHNARQTILCIRKHPQYTQVHKFSSIRHREPSAQLISIPWTSHPTNHLVGTSRANGSPHTYKKQATPPLPRHHNSLAHRQPTTNRLMSHHHDHGHGHGHGHDEEHAEGHNHVHDHSDDITPALQNLLYEQIDFSKLQTLNEDEASAGRKICQKTWAQRMELEPELKSDADEQILMTVP